MLVLPDVDADAIRHLAETMIAEISAPFDVGKPARLQIGIGIGFALSADRSEAPAALIERAERALYEAKRNGKGTLRLDISPAVSPRDGPSDRQLHAAG